MLSRTQEGVAFLDTVYLKLRVMVNYMQFQLFLVEIQNIYVRHIS